MHANPIHPQRYEVKLEFLDSLGIMQLMTQRPLVTRATEWLHRSSGEHFLTDEEHCPTRDIFQARLDKIRILLEQTYRPNDLIYLFIAVAGEIGNNSFDHNLGAWRDVAGIYFVYDPTLKTIVIADRGQGIFKTIQPVKPAVKNDQAALKVAFTETISGRFPEQRGNGLKFVAAVASKNPITIELRSGNAQADVNQVHGLQIKSIPDTISGTLGIITHTIT